jgi:putative transcriptional regulator
VNDHTVNDHSGETIEVVIAEQKAIAAERDAASADAFVREAASEHAGAEEALGELAAVLEPVTPPAALRSRLLDATRGGRFDRYRRQVAMLLDIDDGRAGELLDGIDESANFESSPMDGVDLFHIDGGPTVEDAITGFIRIRRGGVFPHHEHVGHEYVLILQGSCRDTSNDKVFRAGDLSTMVPGSAHELSVEPGPALVYLAVVFEGVAIEGHVYGPDDPDM